MELREKIWQILHNHKREEEWSGVVIDIEAAIKEAGYFQEEADWIGILLKRGWIPPEEVKMGRWVKLAEDQSLPKVAKFYEDWGGESGLAGYRLAREDMLKAGWRKVE